ncbi:MAG: ABC transporter ATP-binding protein [Oscillospiraceae bacterium]|nr:ABC transporter ATP-binding protein [Oscillospiraceae bacterium]
MTELRFEKLTKKYGKKVALDEFSYTLTDGVYGLLGPNGAGKTTLINIIVKLISQTSGEVFFDGKNIHTISNEYFDSIGYMPQYPKFYTNYTARQLLDYLCAIKGIDKKRSKTRIDEMLSFVNLSDEADKKVGAFSGGMRQRLAIAAAMLNDPKVLILDEPTAGLDPKERIRFRNIISRLSENRIVLLATHIVSDVEYIAKECILIDNGKLVKKDSPSKLIDDIKGKVWIVKTDSEQQLNEMIKNRLVGNISYTDEGCLVRMISDEKPYENAENTIPNLEDVYLDIFGKESVL